MAGDLKFPHLLLLLLFAVLCVGKAEAQLESECASLVGRVISSVLGSDSNATINGFDISIINGKRILMLDLSMSMERVTCVMCNSNSVFNVSIDYCEGWLKTVENITQEETSDVERNVKSSSIGANNGGNANVNRVWESKRRAVAKSRELNIANDRCNRLQLSCVTEGENNTASTTSASSGENVTTGSSSTTGVTTFQLSGNVINNSSDESSGWNNIYIGFICLGVAVIALSAIVVVVVRKRRAIN